MGAEVGLIGGMGEGCVSEGIHRDSRSLWSLPPSLSRGAVNAPWNCHPRGSFRACRWPRGARTPMCGSIETKCYRDFHSGLTQRG